MNPRYYRLRLFLDLAHGLFIPSAVLALILRLTRFSPGPFYVPLHCAFIILWAISRTFYHNFLHSCQAKLLGAEPIPQVIGKWPGNIDVLLRMMRAFRTTYVLDAYLDLFEEYRCTTLNLRIMWVDTIITMDQEHSKFIVATGFEHFWRGKSQKERMETFLGEGIFNRDDEKWRTHRSMARPFFARERISDFERIERHTAHILAILSSLESSDEACEAQDLYSRFTLDSASEFLFGQNLNTLSAALPIPGQTAMGPKGSATLDTWGAFAQAFESAQQIVTRRARLGYFWPMFELFGDKSLPHSRTICDWLDPLVNQALEEKVKSNEVGLNSPLEEQNFLQHLAQNTEDPVIIRDQLLSILLASRDTTACLLTFVTYLMATHPEVSKKMRAEVLLHCGPHKAPTYECIRKLKYMRATINETLRLFPPVPLNVRESRAASLVFPLSDASYSSSTDARPLYMPGSTPIIFLPLLSMRNPVLWGPDADSFDPERWMQPERLATFLANPTIFTPFSAGPRICLGQNYAYNEASYFLVRLLQQYDTFTLAPEFQPEGSLPPPEWKSRKGRQSCERIWPAAAMTLYVKGGMWVRFRRSKPT